MSSGHQNSEISVAAKGKVVDKLIHYARTKMHSRFLELTNPSTDDTILDVGASADPAFISSNYLEWASPQLNITAVGLGHDNPIWRKLYPTIPYIHGDALNLPFPDNHFDIVYSHAVIEHVGCYQNQMALIREAVRVARKSVWITTPNRWHPMEFHTVLPFLHWLPKQLHRSLLKKLSLETFANEATLNLLDAKQLQQASMLIQNEYPQQKIEITLHKSTFMGLSANLLLHLQILPRQ